LSQATHLYAIPFTQRQVIHEVSAVTRSRTRELLDSRLVVDLPLQAMLQESPDRMRRSSCPTVLLLVVPAVALAVATPSPRMPSARFEQRESQVSRTLTRASQFVGVSHISSSPACADVQPPEALTTPDPLYTPGRRGEKVKVSFIIGTDGRVHSPLILQSAGLAGDRRVLQTVRTWRYRPATCNGVPTETEGKIEFSSR
jgi:TonB family protein